MNELEAEWNKFIWELNNLMEQTPGNIERIKDCTMIEEWRINFCGNNPFDDDMDHDNWKYSYDLLTREGFDHDTMAGYRDYANRVGMDKGVMALKFPRVNKYWEENNI